MASLCSFRLKKKLDGQTVEVLVVFVAANDLRAEELTGLIDREVQASLAPDELILVARRTSVDKFATSLRAAAEFESVRNRLGRATISAIGFGASGAEISRTILRQGEVVSGMSMAEIGRRCASLIFHRHGGFVEANASYHFLNPSQRHTDRFVRLSNILVSSAEISLMAAMVLPLLPADAEVAHVDTPAMFAIIAAINDHLRVLAPKRRWLLCENFRSYMGVKTHNFTASGAPVVLISASSSGSLADEIARRNVPRDRIGHVLFFGKEADAVRHAIDLSFDADENPNGISDARETFTRDNCKLCAAGSIAVPLKGDQFDMGGPDFDPLIIRKTDAPKGLSAAMGRLAGADALKVSTKRGAGAKQYHIDIAKLLSHASFVAGAEYLARRHIPAMTAECILLDEDSQAFGKMIMAKAGLEPRFIARNELDQLTADDETKDGCKLDGLPVTIVAGAIESGRSLREVSRDLRQVRQKSPLVYLVGCAKHASPAHGDELEKTLTQTHSSQKHGFASVESFILPPSGTPHAWLAEIDFLNEAAAEGIDLGDALAARLDRLNRSSDVLLDELFVPVADSPLTLQRGFVFWPEKTSDKSKHPSSQADVFYTISSVLQALRTNPPNPEGRALRTNWFQQTRLDPANLGRFNDGVIQASILRAARPVEIDYSTKDDFAREAGRAICRIMDAADKPRGEAACEALIAIGSGRLKLPTSELEAILEHRNVFSPTTAKLAQICREMLL